MSEFEEVFPARAGMSPLLTSGEVVENRVPRASGDEPKPLIVKGLELKCSPRERG